MKILISAGVAHISATACSNQKEDRQLRNLPQANVAITMVTFCKITTKTCDNSVW